MKSLRLTKELRARLKNPLGTLIPGPPERTLMALGKVVERENPSKVCVVGDFTAQKAIEHGLRVDMYVVDNRVMRQPVEFPLLKGVKVFRASNPSGTITRESWEAVKRSVDCERRSLLVVDGEEDLLTLAVIKLAPDNSVVAYGQPGVGLVLVRVTWEKKGEIDEIISKMDELGSE